MSNADHTGRFYWFDLMTTDPAAGIAFYSAVVGYEPRKWGEQDYIMLGVGEGAVGGVMELPEDARKMGAPTHWMSYIGHPDVDALVAQVQELGGRSLAPAFDIPSIGRIALLSDPHGGVFGGFTPETGDGLTDAKGGPGHINWHELAAGDLEEAWAFYSALFGWVLETPDMDMGGGAIYRMYRLPGGARDLGGIYSKRPDQPVASWLYYIDVDDLDAALGLVVEHGGQVANGPMDVPGGARVAQCVDPQGGMFALHCAPE